MEGWKGDAMRCKMLLQVYPARSRKGDGQPKVKAAGLPEDKSYITF
jgi:hypothetical protein